MSQEKEKSECILHTMNGCCEHCDTDQLNPKNALKETVGTTQEGKVITETEHAGGRKDVHVEVNMLDVKETDPATLAAKEAIETKVLPRLADADVLVVVVHKPTNEHAQKLVKLPQVRIYAKAAIDAHMGQFKGRGEAFIATTTDAYVIIEHHITNGSVKVTSL